MKIKYRIKEWVLKKFYPWEWRETRTVDINFPKSEDEIKKEAREEFAKRAKDNIEAYATDPEQACEIINKLLKEYEEGE
jgi:hypothetical protein